MLSQNVADRLRAIVGDKWFLDSSEDLATYSYDAFLPEFIPDAVLVPSSKEEIALILKLADEYRFPVIPRGAGTNISGNSVARKGGVILAFHRMNKIIAIEPENMCAVVQPGVVNADLQKKAAACGLMYPPDPGSMSVSTIGGNVALNAGGPRGVKYGAAKDYLLGIEAVVPSGEIIRVGGKVFKSASGYDLTRLLCGSEGTLCIFTEIIVKLVPLPAARATLQAAFADVEDAARTVSAIIGAGIVPTTLELMDRVVLDAISDYAGARFRSGTQAMLLIEVDGEEGSVGELGAKIEKFCMERGAVEIERATAPEEAEKLWAARRSAFGAVASIRPNCIVEDATVPVSMVPAMIKKIVSLAETYRLKIGVLAHAGDGNMHPLIMTDLRDRDEMTRIEAALNEMYEAALGMGGTISGEHGVGIAKDRFMTMEFSETTLGLMRGIKRVFDPNNILNPGSFL